MQSRVCCIAKEKTRVKYCICMETPFEWDEWGGFLRCRGPDRQHSSTDGNFPAEICCEGEAIIRERESSKGGAMEAVFGE